jgi:hypothetical protein
MRITRRQLKRLVETIYAGQKLPDAELERVDDEDYGLKIKANIRHGVDDDGKIVPASPVAIVGGDSGDNMQSSLENIAQGLGTSPEISQNLAKVIQLFSVGVNKILQDNEASGYTDFVQAWSFIESLEIDLDFKEGPLLTIFLDALSGWGGIFGESPGKVIAPEVFNAFRSSLLFGNNIDMAKESKMILALDDLENISEPTFSLIQSQIHPKLFPLFAAGYQQGDIATLNQFVELGLTMYPAGSYENFMIQILIAPYEITNPSWKGIDYVDNLLINEMYTAASKIKSQRSTVASRDLENFRKTGESSISLPDVKRKYIDPKDWNKKRRGVYYDIYITIPADKVFPEDESFEDLSVEVAQYIYTEVLSTADDSYARWMSERPYEYPEIFDAYEKFYNNTNMKPYEDALIRGGLWNMFTQYERRRKLVSAFGDPSDLEVIKFGKSEKWRHRWEVKPVDIEIHLKYTGTKEDQYDKDYHVVEDGKSVSEEYDEWHPINYIKHSWLPTHIEGNLDEFHTDVRNNPQLLIQHAKNLTKQTLDLDSIAKIKVYSQNKSADKIKALKAKHGHTFEEGISRSQLRTLIRQAVLKRII